MLREIIPTVMYGLYTPGTPFVYSVVLLDNPDIPQWTMEQQVHQICADHRTDQEELAVLTSLENFTKVSVIQAILEAYLVGLCNGNLCIAHVTLQELSAYLLVTYELITVSDLEANRSNMVTPFNFTEPIEMLFSKIECKQRYATDSRDPFTLIQLSKMAHIRSSEVSISCSTYVSTCISTNSS